MKKLIAFLLLMISATAFSQIQIAQNKLLKNGQQYSFNQYDKVLENPEAVQLFRRAKRQSLASDILAGLGGGVMGYGLGEVIFGNDGGYNLSNDKETGWALVGIGAGIIGVAIPFVLFSKKNIHKAVETENGTASTAYQPHFRIGSSGSSLVLSYNF